MLKNLSIPAVVPFLRQVAASILIVVGVLITFLPIPVGLILVTIGFTVLAYDNRRIIRRIRIFRRKHPGLSDKIVFIEQKKIWFLSEVLQKTNPASAMTATKK